MARGWGSKSVEDQISEKEEQARLPKREKLTPTEAALREKRDGLLLARTRTVNDLESARDGRYRTLLEQRLAHLDAELAALETTGSD